MNNLIETLIERFTDVKYLQINNFQTFYELAVLFMSIL